MYGHGRLKRALQWSSNSWTLDRCGGTKARINYTFVEALNLGFGDNKKIIFHLDVQRTLAPDPSHI
jgi:hypothetical protein